MRDFGEFTASTQGSAGPRRCFGALWMMAVALVLFAGLALTAFAARDLYGSHKGMLSLLGNTGGKDQQAPAQAPKDSETVNILLVGLDGGKDKQNDGVQRADTLMLARLHPKTGEVSLLSIPRDLYVEGVGPKGEAGRINSAYAYGGVEETVQMVEELVGAPVDHYVAADFKGFEEIVDSLGGVKVQVKKDYLANRGIPTGEQVLDGKHALLYVRYRKTPRGDLGRIERQQQLLAALRSQVLSWDSLSGSPGIVRSLNEHVETDMRVPQMISLGRTLVRDKEDVGLESKQLEGDPVTLSDGREVLDPAEERNEEITYDFLR